MKFSAFFLLACGAVVKQDEALTGLEAVAKRCERSTFGPNFLFFFDKFHRLQFTDSFAFGAEHLISRYIALWVISYVDQVIVNGQPSKDAISNLLYSSTVGKHTSIVYFNKRVEDGKEMLKVSRYIWEHKFQRPNTFSFPIACPLCHRVYSWRNISSYRTSGGLSFELTCQTKIGKGQRCAGTYEVPALPTSSVVDSPYVGTWREM